MSPRRKEFQTETRQVGDDKRRVNHIGARCSTCPRAERIAVNNHHGSLPPEAGEQMFRKRGWAMGSSRAKDVCPACLAKPKAAMRVRHPSAPAPVAVLDDYRPSEPAQVETPKEEPMASDTSAAVRQPTRQDNRRIMDELEACYVQDKGYKGTTTDQTVATKLDVPRAWVTRWREDLFGPEGNEAQAKLLKDAESISARADALETQALEFMSAAEQLKKDAGALLASLQHSLIRKVG